MGKLFWTIFTFFFALGMVAAYFLLTPILIDDTIEENMPGTGPVTTLYKGEFKDADKYHKAKGTAKIIEQEGKRYLRIENFKSTNGPGIQIYLAEDLEAKNYVRIRELRANKGNQNYEIQKTINLGKNNKVLLWSPAFSVLYGSAELKPIENEE